MFNRGKNTCKILKDIRRQIAEQNDIRLVIEECTYKGECLGTCPRCEWEVRYLEEQLEARRKAGKALKVAGISAAMVSMLAPSCAPSHTRPGNNGSPTDTVEMLEGLIERLPDTIPDGDPAEGNDTLPSTPNTCKSPKVPKRKEPLTPPLRGKVALPPEEEILVVGEPAVNEEPEEAEEQEEVFAPLMGDVVMLPKTEDDTTEKK